MKIERVHFYCSHAAKTKDWFVRNIGFRAIGNWIDAHTHTELIALNSAYFLISSPLTKASPIAAYLARHPTGVGDISFRVQNLSAIVERSRRLGLKVLQNIQVKQSPRGRFLTAQITGWNDLLHTLIEAEDDNCDCFNARMESESELNTSASQITGIDHIVLNVARGKLGLAVELYQKLFNFHVQQSFEIKTSASGLTSQALIDETGQVQFNINQPSGDNSQIQEFINFNRGSGIQHLALRSQNLIADMTRLQSGELEFLAVPPAYYRNLNASTYLSDFEQQTVAQQQILVDRDRDYPQSLLMQIFTQPIFEQPTFFLEFIERRQSAKGFGRGNFQALFEAVERQSEHRLSLPIEDKKTVHS
ncbi:MAG: 4-hydroxyphenylpyruvate dioxygenase [Cyanobacteria bacterium J06623_7]